MYGMINRAVKGLVVDRYGAETWERIRVLAKVDEVEFLSMEQYPDELTYRLVAASSEVLGVPADQVLQAFGEYWIEYTAEAGYGEIMRAAGRSLPEFLANLDQLHTRIRFGMPQLRPPSFSVTEAEDGTLLLRYVSEREGLAPLVVGLVKGHPRKFGESAEVELVAPRTKDRPFDEFRIVRTAIVGTA
ncbi:MAG: heme NO-binding domain-containing protein [Phycisphaerales bacterium]